MNGTFSIILTEDSKPPGTPIERIIFIILIILAGIVIYWLYEKIFIPEKEKKSEDYKRNKYKNIDGC